MVASKLVPWYSLLICSRTRDKCWNPPVPNDEECSLAGRCCDSYKFLQVWLVPSKLSTETFFSLQNMSTGFDEFWSRRVLRYDCTFYPTELLFSEHLLCARHEAGHGNATVIQTDVVPALLALTHWWWSRQVDRHYITTQCSSASADGVKDAAKDSEGLPNLEGFPNWCKSWRLRISRSQPGGQ